MKRIVLLASILLSACAQRTGTVCIEAFGIDKVRNSNPIEIKPDVLISLQDTLQQQMGLMLVEKTKMTVAPNCQMSKYILTGNIIYVSSGPQQNRYAGFGSVYDVAVQGKLVRRSDMLSVEDFEDNASLNGAIHTLQTLSEYIMVKIKRDRDPGGN